MMHMMLGLVDLEHGLRHGYLPGSASKQSPQKKLPIARWGPCFPLNLNRRSWLLAELRNPGWEPPEPRKIRNSETLRTNRRRKAPTHVRRTWHSGAGTDSQKGGVAELAAAAWEGQLGRSRLCVSKVSTGAPRNQTKQDTLGHVGIR